MGNTLNYNLTDQGRALPQRYPEKMTQANLGFVKLLKVKRKAEDTPVPILFYEKDQKPYVFRLDSPEMIPEKAGGTLQHDELFSMMRASAKKQKIQAEVVKSTLANTTLEDNEKEDQTDFVYDYYHLLPNHSVPAAFNSDDFGKLAVAEVVFDDTTVFLEDEFEEEDVAEDEEDSNAEDHYGNEYPDEEAGDADDWETDYEDDDDDEVDDYLQKLRAFRSRGAAYPNCFGYDSDEYFDEDPYADGLDDEDDLVGKLMAHLDALDYEQSAEGVLGHTLDYSDCSDQNDPQIQGHYYCESCDEEVYYKRERTSEERAEMIREFYEFEDQIEEEELQSRNARITEVVDSGSE